MTYRKEFDGRPSHKSCLRHSHKRRFETSMDRAIIRATTLQLTLTSQFETNSGHAHVLKNYKPNDNRLGLG